MTDDDRDRKIAELEQRVADLEGRLNALHTAMTKAAMEAFGKSRTDPASTPHSVKRWEAAPQQRLVPLHDMTREMP